MRISFSETVKVNGSPASLSIKAPSDQPNYKFALYYFSESQDKQTTQLSIFELDSNGKFVEREEKVKMRGNTSWRVSMRRSIEKKV